MATKKKEVKEDLLKLEIVISNIGINIFEVGEQKETLISIPNNRIRPIINLIGHLIDEDLPGIISKSELNEKFEVTLKCSLPFEPMFNKD